MGRLRRTTRSSQTRRLLQRSRSHPTLPSTASRTAPTHRKHQMRQSIRTRRSHQKNPRSQTTRRTPQTRDPTRPAPQQPQPSRPPAEPLHGRDPSDAVAYPPPRRATPRPRGIANASSRSSWRRGLTASLKLGQAPLDHMSTGNQQVASCATRMVPAKAQSSDLPTSTPPQRAYEPKHSRRHAPAGWPAHTPPQGEQTRPDSHDPRFAGASRRAKADPNDDRAEARSPVGIQETSCFAAAGAVGPVLSR
jgi:hypothetical protein